MTRKKLIDIICHDHAIPTALGPMLVGDIADRILAALESEREGEVVLWTGEMGGIGLYVPPIPGVEGTHGQVFFRPTKAKDVGL